MNLFQCLLSLALLPGALLLELPIDGGLFVILTVIAYLVTEGIEYLIDKSLED